MTKPTIYLGGPMEGIDPSLWAWREALTQDPLLAETVVFKDPTLRKAFHAAEYSTNLCRKVMKTDLIDIDRSDIVLVNLIDRGDGKCWGSVMEIMYAHTKGKVVIVALDKDFKHPFVEACATVLCHSMEEATHELKDFIAWLS